MKSSKSKRKPTTEDICREYYESQIFRPTGDDEASPSTFFADASIRLEEIDASFKRVDFATFYKEMVAVNFELFGLAWINHYFKPNEESPVSFAPEEIVFTKRYVKDSDIWERMGFYNNAIAETIAEETISRGWGRFRDIPSAIREEDREKIAETGLIAQTEDLIEEFSKYITDSECRGRLVYRFLAVHDTRWDISRITLLSQKLSLTMMKQLGCELEQTGFFALQRFIIGLYENAVNYLDAVREWGSYEAAKDARRSLLQGLKKAL